MAGLVPPFFGEYGDPHSEGFRALKKQLLLCSRPKTSVLSRIRKLPTDVKAVPPYCDIFFFPVLFIN